MHFKDLDSDGADARDVAVGTGVMLTIPLLRELLHSGYYGEIQLEYEAEEKDPLPGMAESLGSMRGKLQATAKTLKIETVRSSRGARCNLP